MSEPKRAKAPAAAGTYMSFQTVSKPGARAQVIEYVLTPKTRERLQVDPKNLESAVAASKK